MSFEEGARFPTDIGYGSRKKIRFATRVVENAGGYTKRNSVWQYALHEYDVTYGIKTQGGLEDLQRFFYAMSGGEDGFRFKDHLDYKSCDLDATVSELDQSLGTYDGSETTYQLVKSYDPGGSLTGSREITKPVSGTVRVAVAGTEITQGADWSVDTTTGIVTIEASIGTTGAVTAGFEFDVPCYFSSNAADLTWDALESGTGRVVLREVRI